MKAGFVPPLSEDESRRRGQTGKEGVEEEELVDIRARGREDKEREPTRRKRRRGDEECTLPPLLCEQMGEGKAEHIRACPRALTPRMGRAWMRGCTLMERPKCERTGLRSNSAPAVTFSQA